MAVGDVVADAVVFVVLTVVRDGLDLDEEKDSDGEFTLLPVVLFAVDVAAWASEVAGELFGKFTEDVNAPAELPEFTATDFLRKKKTNITFLAQKVEQMYG